MNKGKIQNPLTIIAIFAGIAEVTGTTVLLGLPLDVQKIFVWFVMFFPILLVSAFFFVLYSKWHVLYAPSDFKNEKYFVELMASKDHRIKEINKLVKEAMNQFSESTKDKPINAIDENTFTSIKDKLEMIESKIGEAQKETISSNLKGSITVGAPMVLSSTSNDITNLLKRHPLGLTRDDINEKLGGIFALDYFLSKALEENEIYCIGDRYFYRLITGA